MILKIISEDEFYEKFNLCKNKINKDAPFDGCMFETFGDEINFVLKVKNSNPLKIWTITDTEDKLYYESGYHIVNRLGYLITEEETENNIDYIVELENFDDDKINDDVEI